MNAFGVKELSETEDNNTGNFIMGPNQNSVSNNSEE